MRRAVAAYGIALVATGLAGVVRWLLDPVLGGTLPFFTFYFATLLAAWQGGLAGGALSVVMGIAAGAYFFTAPRQSLALDGLVHQLDLVRYFAVGIAVSVICELLHRMRHRSELQGEELRTTFASVGDAIITTDTAGRVVLMNAVAESLTGWPCREAAGQPLEAIFRIVNEHSRQPVENPVTKALREGTVVGLANHTVLIARDGTERAIDDSAAPIRAARDGVTRGCVLVFRDVTERRREDRELSDRLAAAHLLASIVESSDDAVVSKTLDGTIRSWNAGAERIFGYSQAEAVGQPITMLIPGERLHEEDEILARIHAGERIQNFDTLRRRKDGSLVPVNLSISPIRDAGGRITGASKVARDISARKRSEAFLAGYRDVLERVVSNAPLPDVLTRVCGVIEAQYPELLCSLLLPDEQCRHTGFAIGASLATTYLRELEGLRVDPPYIGACAAALHSGAVIVVPDVAHETRFEPEWRALLLSHGLRACLSLPVFDTDGKVLASLCLYGKTPGDPAPQDSTVLATLMQLIGIAITRQRLDEQIRRSTALLNLMVERCPYGIYIVDADFRIIHMNAGSQTGAYRNVRPVIGRAFDEAAYILWQEADAAEVVARFRHTLKTGESWYLHDFVAARVDSDRLESYEVEIHRVTLPDGSYGVICYYYDSTRLRNTERELRFQIDLSRRLMADLSEADRRKNEFLATLAHELRNPLAPLQNALQILGQADNDVRTVARLHDMMERQLDHLVHLVDDLMDVSRITRGRVELRKQPVSLVTVLNTAIETSRPLLEQMGQTLSVELPPPSLLIDADTTRLAQAFINLLNNAAKYSNRGGQVTLGVTRGAHEVVISVRDSGIGIAPEELNRIFDMFVQTDRSLDKAQGGLGIGLTLAKRLVEMHGGAIEAHSEGLGRGSEFVVRLPIVEAATGVPAAGPRDAPPIAHAPLRILIVDDNRDGADSLAMLLETLGHETRTAYDGLAGVDAVACWHPDLVLLDIGLPKLNGYEACRRIRQEPWGARIVSIATTGWGQDEDRRLSQAAGFDHHLVKPVSPEELIRLLPQPQAVTSPPCVQ